VTLHIGGQVQRDRWTVVDIQRLNLIAQKPVA
jgi:hypothetical protein